MKIPYLLSLVTWLPAVGAIIILAVFRKGQARAIKRFATAWFFLVFLVSLALLAYDRAVGGMQFIEDRQWIPVIGARYQMGADGVAVVLIVLTTPFGWSASLSSLASLFFPVGWRRRLSGGGRAGPPPRPPPPSLPPPPPPARSTAPPRAG